MEQLKARRAQTVEVDVPDQNGSYPFPDINVLQNKGKRSAIVIIRAIEFHRQDIGITRSGKTKVTNDNVDKSFVDLKNQYGESILEAPAQTLNPIQKQGYVHIDRTDIDLQNSRIINADASSLTTGRAFQVTFWYDYIDEEGNVIE